MGVLLDDRTEDLAMVLDRLLDGVPRLERELAARAHRVGERAHQVGEHVVPRCPRDRDVEGGVVSDDALAAGGGGDHRLEVVLDLLHVLLGGARRGQGGGLGFDDEAQLDGVERLAARFSLPRDARDQLRAGPGGDPDTGLATPLQDALAVEGGQRLAQNVAAHAQLLGEVALDRERHLLPVRAGDHLKQVVGHLLGEAPALRGTHAGELRGPGRARPAWRPPGLCSSGRPFGSRGEPTSARDPPRRADWRGP
jgi:hypothetical protein